MDGIKPKFGRNRISRNGTNKPNIQTILTSLVAAGSNRSTPHSQRSSAPFRGKTKHSGNINGNPPVLPFPKIVWFEPTSNTQTDDSEGETEQPSVLSRNNLVVDNRKLAQAVVTDHKSSCCPLSPSLDSLFPSPSESNHSLENATMSYDFEPHDGNQHSEDSLPEIEIGSKRLSTENVTRRGARNPPGRYKIKILEKSPQPMQNQKSKTCLEVNNSPYRCDKFIDVDGQLKINGKSFNTFVSHAQYRLLKEYYIPGVIASKYPMVSPNHSKRFKLFQEFLQKRSRPKSQTYSTPSNPDRTNYVPSLNTEICNAAGIIHSVGIDVGEQTFGIFQAQADVQTSTFDLQPEIVHLGESDRDHKANMMTSRSVQGMDESMFTTLFRSSTEALEILECILLAQEITMNSDCYKSSLVVLQPDILERIDVIMKNLRETLPSTQLAPNTRLARLLDAHVAVYSQFVEFFRLQEQETAEDLHNLISSFTAPSETSVGDTFVGIVAGRIGSENELQNFRADTTFRFGPEVDEYQFRVEFRSSGCGGLCQEVGFRDTSYCTTYNDSCTEIIQATARMPAESLPISLGCIIRMTNQHASLAVTRVTAAKFFFGRVSVKMLVFAKHFFPYGKLAFIMDRETDVISSRDYKKLREINIFSGIMFALACSFLTACKGILISLACVIRNRQKGKSKTGVLSPISMSSKESRCTIPNLAILPRDKALDSLLVALEELGFVQVTGSNSLRALTGGNGIRLRSKFYKVIVTFLEGTHQLLCTRELDFGGVLVGLVADTLFLRQLREEGQVVINLKQEIQIYQHYYDLYHCCNELNKLGKKICLISSFTSTKSMTALHRFRHTHRQFSCIPPWIFRRIWKNKRKIQPIENGEIFKYAATNQDVLLTGKNRIITCFDLQEHDNQRLAQMLHAISNESSISARVF